MQLQQGAPQLDEELGEESLERGAAADEDAGQAPGGNPGGPAAAGTLCQASSDSTASVTTRSAAGPSAQARGYGTAQLHSSALPAAHAADASFGDSLTAHPQLALLNSRALHQ